MINLNKEIDSFFCEIGKLYDFDIVFAVQRKGMASLKMHMRFRELIGKKVFFMGAINFIGPNDLKDKKVLIYDDACSTGNKLNEAYNKLKSMNVVIKTAALVANKSAEYKPDYYRFCLPTDDFKALVSSTSDEHFGDEIYDDHVVYKLKVKLNNVEEFLSSLSKYGILKELQIPPQYKTNKLRIFSIENLSFLNIFKLFGESIKKEGVEKFRIFIHENGRMNIVPRFYPAIRIDKIDKHCCKEGTLKLCLLLKHIPTNVSSEIRIYRCAKCMILTINVIALSTFIPIIKELLLCTNNKILSNSINETDLCAALFKGSEVIMEIKKILKLEEEYETKYT